MTPERAPEPAAERAGIARSGAVMAAGALASRATGFVRTAVIGAVLGAGLVGDAYATATMLPGIVYEVLLGGTLAGMLVPLLVRARDTDPDAGQAHAQRMLTLAVLVFAAATVLVVAAVPVLVALLSTGHTTPASRGLVTAWSYLVLPTIFFYGLGAVLTAILNARGHFAVPTWAPMLNNVILVATAGIFAAIPAATDLTPETITAGQVAVLGGGTLLGVAVQAAGLWPAARRVGLRWRWRFDLRALHLGQLAGLTGWLLCYVAVSQIGVFVVIALVKAAGDRGGPGPFIYGNGWLMLMMGYGVAALPIITALQPRLAAPAGDRADTFRRLTTGTRMIVVVLAPVAVAYLVLGGPLAVTLFEWHRYTSGQAADTGLVIAVAGLCLIPYAISQAQTFAFYALSDAKTPALLNIPVVALRIGTDVVLFLTVPVEHVAAAMMAGNGISYLVAAVAGWWLLRRHGLRGADTATAPTVLRASAAAVVAALTAAAAAYVAGRWLEHGKLDAAVQLAVAGPILVATYLAIAHAIRIPEARQLVTKVHHQVSAGRTNGTR